MADNITVNEGTAKAIAADDVSSVWFQKVKLDIGADGASSVFTGTITETANLAKGTITALQGGTVENLDGGTITALQGGTIENLDGGTVQTFPTIHGDAWGTVVETTGTATGTIHPLVSGSAIYITDLIISTNSGGTIIVGDGTPTVKLVEAYLAANGGFVSNFVTPRHTTSGSALVFNQPGSGTITITCTGYID